MYFAQLELDVENDIVNEFDGDDYSHCMEAVTFATKLINLIRVLLHETNDRLADTPEDGRTVSTIGNSGVEDRWLRIGRKLHEQVQCNYH